MSESISDTSLDAVSDAPSDLSVESPIPKPGGLLKSKRLENEWTKEDVAKTLLLSAQRVEALENDEYDKLPGATYVVGYWRSYANLLKIDISESIEFHKNNLEISPSVIALETGHRRAHDYQEKARKRSGLVFFILSVMFLAGIWYWQNPDDPPLNQWFDDREKTNVNDDDNQVISGEVTSAILEPGQDDFSALPEPNFSDDITETDVGERQLVPTQSIEKASENVSEPAAETPVAGSPNWIFIRVEKKSWLDVRDVIGEKLIYRIVKAGESISLKGVPPFYVFVGTVDGVQVEYLGKPVHFKVDENSLFARFRVGRVGKIQTNER